MTARLFFFGRRFGTNGHHTFSRERERERERDALRAFYSWSWRPPNSIERAQPPRGVLKNEISRIPLMMLSDIEDRVSNDAFVKKLIKQWKEIEEKWFAFEQQKWFDTQRNIQADRELEKMKREVEEKKREVEELKFEAMTRMMTAQLQSRNYNRLGQISPYYGNS